MSGGWIQGPTRLLRDERGGALVEFAIIIPLLAALVVGVGQYALMIPAYQQMHAAVQSGAVYVMRGGSDTPTVASVSLSGWANKPSDAAVSASKSCTCGSTSAVCSALCLDGSYPRAFINISATGTYTGLTGSQSMSTVQSVRIQ